MVGYTHLKQLCTHQKQKVSVGEFHGHLNAQATKFSERVFAILDQDMSGLLNLREFIVGIWNYCTYDVTLVSKVRTLLVAVAVLFLFLLNHR